MRHEGDFLGGLPLHDDDGSGTGHGQEDIQGPPIKNGERLKNNF